jgi:hypothetical protein
MTFWGGARSRVTRYSDRSDRRASGNLVGYGRYEIPARGTTVRLSFHTIILTVSPEDTAITVIPRLDRGIQRAVKPHGSRGQAAG